MSFKRRKKNIFRKPTLGDKIKKLMIILLIMVFIIGAVFALYKIFTGVFSFNTEDKPKKNIENMEKTKANKNVSNKDLKIKVPKKIVALENMPVNIDKIATLQGGNGKVSFVDKPNFKKAKMYNVEIKGGNNLLGYTKLKIKVNVISIQEALNGTEFLTGNGNRAKFVNGILTVEGTQVANKFFLVPPTYSLGIQGKVYEAYDQLRMEAAKQGLTYFLIQGNRNYYVQRNVFENYKYKFGLEKALFESNPPGAADSQLGDTLELNEANPKFIDKKAGKWLNDNCYKYGFIIRYPKNAEKYTLHRYEPWNIKFVGMKLAKKLYNKGKWKSLEEYYGIPAKSVNL